MTLDEKLDFWIANNKNVLFEGSHGIGKTAIIESAFKRAGLNYRYFSAATMDPWVDFIGVPKEKQHADGTSSLELIRPIEFQDGSIDAIIFDEFNRAPAKIRNAVMELLQAKSINGKPIPGLRMIWGAINPSDDEGTYNVEELDPAHVDRFHIHVTLPNEPNLEYFCKVFGDHIGSRAVQWWTGLAESAQKLVTPRRLEYALEVFQIGGDLEDVLHPLTLPNTLKQRIELIDITSTHTSRWLTDPQRYITELSDRTIPTKPTDLVDAFEALSDVSTDLAVSYVGQISPAAIKTLACSPRTLPIVVSTALNDIKRRQIVSVLTSGSIVFPSFSDQERHAFNHYDHHVVQNTELYIKWSGALYAKTHHQTNSFTSNKLLNDYIKDQINSGDLSCQSARMIYTMVLSGLHHIDDEVFRGIAKQILYYAAEKHPAMFTDIVCMDPQSAFNVIK